MVSSAETVPAVSVTVVVPVWNRRDLLEALLGTLRHQTQPPAEVIVVDSGSADGAPEVAERWGARVIRLGRNAGFSRAANTGLAEVRTEWTALVNSDVELAPDWIARLSAAAQGDAWFATGKALKARDPKTIDGLFDVVARSGCAWRVGHGQRDANYHVPGQTVAVSSATAALFRTELFARTGPFDERFESYLEDVDLGFRCAALGLRGVYVPEAVCRHHGGASKGRWSPYVVRHIARNQVWLVAKYYSPELLRRELWRILVGQGLWGLVALRHGQVLAWLNGKFEGLRSARSMRGKADVAAFLEEGERQIRRLQGTRPDAYWAWYFRLTGAGGEK